MQIVAPKSLVRSPRKEGLPAGWRASDGCVSFNHALAAAANDAPPQERWLEPLLACSPEDAPRLFAAADRVRAEVVGAGVYLRGLVEFSNICRCDCLYCGLRRSNRAVERYRLSVDDIIAAAHRARSLGYGTVVLQSGEDLWFTADRLAQAVRSIKDETGLAVTLSVGERDEDTYRAWKDAGADRVLVRIETTDPDLFARLHPGDDIAARMACLRMLRSLGYQLGTGIMVGLPAQTPSMVARDVMWMHELGAEMIGIGPFLPHPETPLADASPGTIDQALRLVAVLRLVFPRAHLPATTAMGTIHPRGRELALQAGANIMMPNTTRVSVRPLYQLYTDRICIDETPDDCQGCMERRVASIGRTIAPGPGHVLRG